MKDVNKCFFYNHFYTICDRRENKRRNGLEVPRNYLLKGPDKYLEKAECTIKYIVGRAKII